jgi:hypothetical protein
MEGKTWFQAFAFRIQLAPLRRGGGHRLHGRVHVRGLRRVRQLLVRAQAFPRQGWHFSPRYFAVKTHTHDSQYGNQSDTPRERE